MRKENSNWQRSQNSSFSAFTSHLVKNQHTINSNVNTFGNHNKTSGRIDIYKKPAHSNSIIFVSLVVIVTTEEALAHIIVMSGTDREL